MKTKDGDAKEDNAVFAKDLYRMAKRKKLIPKASTFLYSMYIIFGVGKIKRGINRIRYRIYDIILSRPKIKKAIKRILNRK